MTDAAIIQGSLVDVRNVGTHKSVKLTVHVPEEYATKVVAAFGWPTGVKPVAVAVARMNVKGGGATANARTESTTETQPRSSTAQKAGADKPKSPAQVAGYLCTVPAFQAFLIEDCAEDWDACRQLGGSQADIAAEVVRLRCGVNSRSEIKPDNPEWRALVGAYRAWELAPGVVG